MQLYYLNTRDVQQIFIAGDNDIGGELGEPIFEPVVRRFERRFAHFCGNGVPVEYFAVDGMRYLIGLLCKCVFCTVYRCANAQSDSNAVLA